MADCQKHFQCVDPADFSPLKAGTLGIVSVILAVIGGVTGQWLLGVASAAAFVSGVFDLCRFLEGGKLVCLERNVCVIGRVVKVIPVGSDKSGLEKMDDDFTFNLVLSPHSDDETLNDIQMSDPYQSKLITEQTAIMTQLNLPYGGHDNGADSAIDEVLHCEVKGCRVHDVCIVLKAMSFPIAAALAGCSIPVIGWIACLIALVVLALITLIVGGIVWAATHNGDINDVLDPESGEMVVGSIVVVTGDWVYDAGHSGWNEIHPVRHVQVIELDNRFQGNEKASRSRVERFNNRVLEPWCHEVETAGTDPVRDAQSRPENDWHIHPDVDGCKPEPVIE